MLVLLMGGIQEVTVEMASCTKFFIDLFRYVSNIEVIISIV
jgi:hypothetical protein